MSGYARFASGAALVLAALLLAAPARAQPAVFLELTPNTIQAGFQFSIRASCGDQNQNPATIRSEAFGQLTLQPATAPPAPGGRALLTGTVRVPESTRPSTYRVDLICPDGGTASAELVVLNGARPTRGPATGGGGRGTVVGTDLALVLLAAGGLLAVAAGGGLLLAGRRA